MSTNITPTKNIAFRSTSVARDFQNFRSSPTKSDVNFPSGNTGNAINTVAAGQIQSENRSAGPIQGTKNFIAGLKKAWVYVAEYTKGAIKGVFEGGLLGGLTFLGIWGVKAAKTRAIKSSLPKRYSLSSAIAAGVGALTLGYQLFKSSLNVSERTAAIDHRYNTGHRYQG